MTPRPPRALYVHIPFCLSICPYCDFVVYAGRAARGPENRIAGLVAALHVEMDLRADALDDRFGAARPGLTSIYFGGGTPSLLPSADLAGLLDHVERRFGIASGAEITLEANPAPADRGDLAGFRAAGVERLSLGAQSMDGAELRTLGRRHTPADVVDAVAAARTAGFRNISLDLLEDVPGQTAATWERTLADAMAMAPEHLSVYAFTLDDPDAEGLTGPTGDHLPVSTGARAWRRRARAAQDDDRAADLHAMATERLADGGLAGYELSNWARPGFESRHNLAYWHRDPYEALGPGAHAFDGAVTRRWNAARLDAYVAELGAGRLPLGGEETLDPNAAQAEALILGLRLSQGVASADVMFDAHASAALTWAVEAGLAERWVERAADRVRLTARGRLLSNEVFLRLLPERSAAAGSTPGLAA
ncbi:MAG: radical SAM family heme chaperone HemW [Candidatus Limnocylindrales bacterium]